MTTHTPLNRRHVACAERPGGPEVLDVKTEDVAPPGPGDAVVRVEAVGLNHVETLVRSGTYSIRVAFPYYVGIEGAGTVLAVGSDLGIAPGTRVCWTGIFGSCATVLTAPARMLAALPDGLDFEAGASLAHAGLTAAGLARHCPLAKRARAVVWGAAGAVGRVLVALLADRDVSVIGIASGTRVEAVRRAGAEFVVDRVAEDVVEAVRAHTRGEGVAAVFDPVGTATYETSVRLLAPRGCLVNYGQLSGSLPTVDLNALMEAGSVFVTKYGPRAGLIDRNHIASCISHALALARTRPLTCDVAARFPLSSVSDAYRMLESHPAGKVLVLPQVRLKTAG